MKSLATGEVTEQKNYTYDATYKDRLIGFGEESIGGYDLQGRPTNYRGMSLEWTHGRVSKFTKGGFTQTCTYDANGIRTEKIENGKTHKYYVEDSQIVREVVTGSENYELYYLYGATGIAGFTLKTANGSTNYYYRKNLLGDVTAIYDAAGVCKAEYAYDAWGNCKVISDMGGIAALNPFRYCGYYWDEEINLYYLNTRYYDPEVGRFISADHIKYMAEQMWQLNGCNLYAYCLNNPILYYDPLGMFVISIALSISALFFVVSLLYIESQTHVVGGFIDDCGKGVSDFLLRLGNDFSLWIENIEFSKSKGRGRDSEFIDIPNTEEENSKLEEMMERARKNGDFELANRIQRELKNRGYRNKRKNRKGPRMRGVILLYLLEKFADEYKE